MSFKQYLRQRKRKSPKAYLAMLAVGEKLKSGYFLSTILLYVVSLFFAAENENDDNPNLFEGDMLLSPSQRYAAMLGLDVSTGGMGRASIFKNPWPGAVLPYTIDNNLSKYH